MFNKFFKSFIAVAMVLGSALGFVACNETDEPTTAEPKVELSASTLNFSKFEESQSVDIKSNSEWTVEVEESADWVTVTPKSGSKNGKITIAVSENSTGKVRTATVKVYAMHKTYGKYGNEKLTIQQSNTENATIDEVLLYGDDFDGAEATKTYGSGSSWPYIDQFPEFANPKGDAAANVTYTGSKVSVRANQPSNQSTYSNYAGSGSNNIFFGDGGYFVVNNIAPLSADDKNYKISFGVQKYAGSDGDSSFNYTDFLLYISKDGENWAPVEYTIADLVDGKYNVATADFTLAAATDKLYIKFVAKVASVLRIDDLKFFVGNGGQVIDLDNIEAPQPVEAKKVTVAEFLAAAEDSTIYELTGEITSVTNTTYGNFYLNDGTAEVLIYGLCSPSGEQKYWAESGAKVGDTITVQTVRTSYNGTPQGKNAIFVSLVPGEGGSQTPEPAEGPYASDAAFVCSTDDSTNAAYSITGTSINGNAATGFKLGKSKQAGKFTSGVVSVSGNKYLNFYAQGWKGGDVTLYFRVNGGATMSQKLASHDGVTGNPPYTALSFAETDHYSVLLEGLTETSTIEFSTDANFELTTADSTMASARAIVCGVKLSDEPINPEDGGNTENPTPEPGEVVKATVAEFLAAAEDNTVYELTGVIKNVVAGKEYYGNFDLEDSTGSVYIYGLVDDAGNFGYFETLGLKEGDTITIQTVRTSYNGTPQGKNATYVSHTPGSGTTPEPEPSEVVKATVAEFLAAAEDNTIYELTGEITSVANTTYGNFYIKDDTGEVYIYGLCSPEGEQKYWAESGVKVGDIITIQTVRTSYDGTPQGKNAIYVSHVSVEVEKPEIPEGCVEASIVFVNAGYANEENVDGKSIALDNNVSVVFAKGGAGTAPAYYNSGEAIRMYQNGSTLDVTANGKSIKSIELTFSNNQYYLAANCGELSEEAAVRTWTGDATAVKFTSTGTDKNHRAYVSAIKVIYAE